MSLPATENFASPSIFPHDARCIIEACREQGVEEPIWRWDGGFVYVVFNRPKHEADILSIGKNVSDKENNKESVDNDKKVGYYDKELRQRNLSELQLEMLKQIQQQPSITLNELAIRLAISVSLTAHFFRSYSINGSST